MYLSNSQRAKKLTLSLMLNPKDLISYLRFSLTKKTSSRGWFTVVELQKH
mgnify:CR=1 FL=1